MADDYEAKLKARYGQDRFNPAAGQFQMTEQEWIDRHPSLKGRSDLSERYQKAVGAEGGAAFQSKNPDWRTMVVGAPKALSPGRLNSLGKLIGGPDGGADHMAAANRLFNKIADAAAKDPKGAADRAARHFTTTPTGGALQARKSKSGRAIGSVSDVASGKTLRRVPGGKATGGVRGGTVQKPPKQQRRRRPRTDSSDDPGFIQDGN